MWITAPTTINVKLQLVVSNDDLEQCLTDLALLFPYNTTQFTRSKNDIINRSTSLPHLVSRTRAQTRNCDFSDAGSKISNMTPHQQHPSVLPSSPTSLLHSPYIFYRPFAHTNSYPISYKIDRYLLLTPLSIKSYIDCSPPEWFNRKSKPNPIV